MSTTGHPHRVAVADARRFEPVVGGDRGRAVLDGGALGGGAADVEIDHVGLAAEAADEGGAVDARRRARFEQRDRVCPGPAEARGAAVRLHRHLGAGEAERVEAGLQRVEIALHDRLHVGVEHGRVGALVLAPLAGDFVGGGDAHARQALAQVGLARGLVRGRGVGVEELDGDGLHSLGPAHLDHRVQVFEMQRRTDPPLGVDALAHLEPEPARHEGDLLAVAQIVEIGAVAACDLEHVAEALGVVTSAVFAPVRSVIALITVVPPWTK